MFKLNSILRFWLFIKLLAECTEWLINTSSSTLLFPSGPLRTFPTVASKNWLHLSSSFLRQHGMIERTIQQKLLDLFEPEHLEIINESFMHNVPKGSETHFKIILVSKDFEGKNLLQRHRQINKCLWDELQTGVHALSIVAHTKSEWKEKGEVVNRSPPCMGGDAGRH